MSSTYKNPFHHNGYQDSKPEYSTDVPVSEYNGYFIYTRIKGVCYDIVHDGVCVGIYAGPAGARAAIDNGQLKEKQQDLQWVI